MPIYSLDEDLVFPHPSLSRKDGLLAVHGDLSPQRLLLAYCNGIFPWFSEDEPILWWSPDPRFIIYPKDIKVSHSMKKLLKKIHIKLPLTLVLEKSYVIAPVYEKKVVHGLPMI